MNFIKLHKKKIIVFVLGIVMYVVGTLLGIELPLDALLQSDLSVLGEGLEAGVE